VVLKSQLGASRLQYSWFLNRSLALRASSTRGS
jgi:hypothetical protein